jgi:hypothetical protein
MKHQEVKISLVKDKLYV